MTAPGPPEADHGDAPTPARVPQLLLTVLLSLLVVAAVVASVVGSSGVGSPGAGGGGSGEPGPGAQARSPQELADAMAGAAPGVAPLDERPAPDARTPLPDTELESFAGGPVRHLDEYAGTPLVLNFWASWCGPCVEEMPAIDAVAQRAGGEVAFLGVNRDDEAAAAEALVADLGVGYDLATDVDDTLFPAVDGFGMPTTLFVDADGVIRYRRTGELDAAELTRLLDRELGVDLPAPGRTAAPTPGTPPPTT